MKSKPKNVVDGTIRGMLFVNTTNLVIHLAGGVATNTPNLLVISGLPVMSARLDATNGRVLLSALIHDKSGNVIAKLEDNEWSVAPAEIWDFEAYPLHASIRHGPGDIAFAVDVRDDAVQLRGKWHYNGRDIDFNADRACVGGVTYRGNNTVNCGGYLGIS